MRDVDWSGFLIRAERAQHQGEDLLARSRFAEGFAKLKEARDEDDEKHVHPLQLDVIERVVTLWSNPGEKVLTPFMGVGSEVYVAVKMSRLGIGVELKSSYYRQAVRNVQSAADGRTTEGENLDMFEEALASAVRQ